MSELTLIDGQGKPYHKQVVDEKGSRVIEFDKDSNEVVVSEKNRH